MRAVAARKHNAAPPKASDVGLQLATLVDISPRGDGWLFETKYDGYRMLARVQAGEATLTSRNGGDYSAKARPVLRELGALPLNNALLDGELVCPTKNKSAGSFQALQNALDGRRHEALVFVVFDLLFLDGADLRALPLEERKSALEVLLAQTKSTHLKYSRHVRGDGAAMLGAVCGQGLEGLIAKRAAAPYRGGRGKSWLKLKCTGRQEFVVVGYSAPSGSRQHLGALLVATRDQGVLRYAGKVGSGFSQASLADLAERLAPLRRDTPASTGTPSGREALRATWVEPKLVVEVEFTEFTRDGRLRHPSFQGVRKDKSAREVRRERAHTR